MSEPLYYAPSGNAAQDIGNLIRIATRENKPAYTVISGVRLNVDPELLQDAGRFQLSGTGHSEADLMAAGAEEIHRELQNQLDRQLAVNEHLKGLADAAKAGPDAAASWAGKLASLSETPGMMYDSGTIAAHLTSAATAAGGTAKAVLDAALEQLQTGDGKLQSYTAMLGELHEQGRPQAAPVPDNRGKGPRRIRLADVVPAMQVGG